MIFFWSSLVAILKKYFSDTVQKSRFVYTSPSACQIAHCQTWFKRLNLNCHIYVVVCWCWSLIWMSNGGKKDRCHASDIVPLFNNTPRSEWINGWGFQINFPPWKSWPREMCCRNRLTWRSAIISDYFPNHNQTGAMLSVTSLNSNGVLVRKQCLIIIAVLYLRWKKMHCAQWTHPQSDTGIIHEMMNLLSCPKNKAWMTLSFVNKPHVNCL